MNRFTLIAFGLFITLAAELTAGQDIDGDEYYIIGEERYDPLKDARKYSRAGICKPASSFCDT